MVFVVGGGVTMAKSRRAPSALQRGEGGLQVIPPQKKEKTGQNDFANDVSSPNGWAACGFGVSELAIRKAVGAHRVFGCRRVHKWAVGARVCMWVCAHRM